MNDNILDPQDTIKSYLELMPETQRDPEALAKAKYHADTHIKTLEARMDELRSDYLKEHTENQARAKLEDQIKILEQQLASNEQPSVKEVIEKPTIDLDELDKRFDQKLQDYEVTKRQQDNANFVKNKLKERFGDNYPTVVNQQINDLGLSTEDFNALARKSPAALLKTLGVEETSKERYQNPIRGTSGFSPKVEPKRTWSYYQSMKKENPRLYHDPKITTQMEHDAMELGDAFMDGDFNKFQKGIQ